MEGMTEEQKEYEAMKLVDMFDKLSRSIKAGYARTHARTHRPITREIPSLFLPLPTFVTFLFFLAFVPVSKSHKRPALLFVCYIKNRELR